MAALSRGRSAATLWRAGLLAAVLATCGSTGPARAAQIDFDAQGCVSDFDPAVDYYPDKADIRHADNFSISYHGHYKVLRARMPATNWGPEVSDVVVLHRCGTPAPQLEGELAGATVVETPIRQFATNSVASALRLRVLGLERSIAAMPVNAYDQGLAEELASGRAVAVGVHGEPHLEGMLVLGVDALVVFTSSLEHTAGLERSRELGIPAFPLLSWAEPTILGQAEWIKHHAALFDAEADAERFFAEVEGRYRALAESVADVEPVNALWATPMDPGRWWVEAGNWQDEVLRAAGGRNVFTAAPDESSIIVGSERLLEVGDSIAVWITGEPDGMALADALPVTQVAAWGAGRTWHTHGRSDEARDAYDWNETPLVRPDLVLEGLIHLLHPERAPATPPPGFFARIDPGASR